VAKSLTLLAVALLAAEALAQPAPQPPARCDGIRNDAERLACHDRESGRRAAAPSLIGDAWALDAGTERVELNFYQPNYLLGWRHSDRVNAMPCSPRTGFGTQDSLDDDEVKYQISFKARLFVANGRRWGLWGAYTQQSHLQLYNEENSRPFRETNYMPEVMLVYDPQLELAGWRLRLASVGFTHQSNGRSAPLSRSWNRLVGQLGVEKGDFAFILRPWVRIHERASGDDNPDITDYYGYGDLTLLYKVSGHSLNLMLRGNLREGKGAVQFGWTTPKMLGPLRGYVQIFSGYGESLIDYNWRQNTFGIGIALNDLL